MQRQAGEPQQPSQGKEQSALAPSRTALDPLCGSETCQDESMAVNLSRTIQTEWHYRIQERAFRNCSKLIMGCSGGGTKDD